MNYSKRYVSYTMERQLWVYLKGRVSQARYLRALSLHHKAIFLSDSFAFVFAMHTHLFTTISETRKTGGRYEMRMNIHFTRVCINT